jgi:filamentous hemagglutinin family protein
MEIVSDMNRTPALVAARRSFPRTLSPLALAVAAGLSLTVSAVAGPGVSGGQVVSGSASIHQSGGNTTIHAGNNAIINYQSFNIGAGQSVRFVQPSSTSRVLNRITGPDPSTIAGSLQSNGIVYIANPAGVYFAHGALVNVGGIYAAAGRISNADFLNNINRFTLSGAVENHGFISGAQVHLLGQRAANFGTIVAPGSAGIVTMTAGDEVMIGRVGGQIMARVSGGGGETGVTQAGDISAPGNSGRIQLGAGDMYALAIDHRGSSTARTITMEGGATGVVSVSGTVDASAISGKGGTVKLLGEKVGVISAEISADGPAGGGTVLVGGGRMGRGAERNATATYISPDSTISADATHKGQGGTVIVWSDQVSRIYGELSARGGTAGGDGGFVETSSARELHVSRTPDVTARARTARGGTWLIDPEDLTIIPGGDQTAIGTTPPPPTSIFESTGAGAELGVDLIIAALTGGANVEIRTGATGPAEGGTITLRDDVDLDYDGTGLNTLSLIAHRDIILDGQIRDSDRTSPDRLNLVLVADSDSSGEGSVVFNNLVDTGGGLININGFATTIGARANILTRGGNIHINVGANGIATLQSGLNAGPGTMTFDSIVVLDNDITLRAHEIIFNRPVSANPVDPHDLTLNTINNGTTRFNESIGSPAGLGTLRTNADGTTILNGAFVNALEVDFANPVILHRNTNVVGENSARFGSTVDSLANQMFNLRTGGNIVTFTGNIGAGTDGRLGDLSTVNTGNTIYQGAINATTLTTNNNVTLGGGVVATTGDQTYNGPVIVSVDNVLTGANITFNSRVNSSFATDRALTLNTTGNGITTFAGAVGAINPLSLITTNADGTTIFGGGSVITSGNQTYNNPVLVTGNTSVTGSTIVFHNTINSGAEAQSLEISTTDTVRFEQSIGQTSPLFSLSIASEGRTQLDGGAVTTVGAQVYNNRVVLGEDTVLAGSGVSFGRALDGDLFPRALEINTTGNGQTTFSGPVGGSTPLTRLTTNADGSTRLFGNTVVTVEDQVYNNPVILGGTTVTLRASAFQFLSSINSSGLFSEGGLIVNTTGAGVTNFAGPIGNINPIRELTTNAAGTTRIGADITTAGSMTFNDSVILTGDAVLRESANGSIIFGSSVNSDGTPRALSLLVNPDSNATPAAPSIARIVFGSDVGGSSALRSLRLGDNRTTNATAATIVGGIGSGASPISNFSMVINTTEGFTMGRGQRFTSLGNLTINAGGPATLGDITALGNLSITAPDIAIQTRPGGQILTREGNTLVLRNDPSVDIIALRQINFSTAPRVVGDFNRPSFGTPEGRGMTATLNDFPQRAIGTFTLDQLRLGTAILDLRAAGPGNTNVAEAIAGAVPRVDYAASVENVVSGQSQLEELALLGITADVAGQDQSLPFLTGVVGDDAPSMMSGETRVSPRRLPPGAVAQVLGSYRTLFYGDSNPAVLDDQVREERIAHISGVLASAWNEYAQAVGRRADPVGFRAYVEAVPAQAEALYYLNALRDLFTQMGYLGLTTAEVRSARQEIVRAVAFTGLPPAQLETAIMATFLGNGTPAARPAPAR